jgi:hypothetical protein
LRFSGRFSVIVITPSAISTSTTFDCCDIRYLSCS